MGKPRQGLGQALESGDEWVSGWWKENSDVFRSSLPLTFAELSPGSCEAGQACDPWMKGGNRGPDGWVTQSWGTLPIPNIGPFHQGLSASGM